MKFYAYKNSQTANKNGTTTMECGWKFIYFGLKFSNFIKISKIRELLKFKSYCKFDETI